MRICKNPKCNKEFKPVRNNIKTCSNKCSKIFYTIKLRKTNPEYNKLKLRKYRLQNIELARKKSKIYYYKNKKHRLALHKKWRDKNKEQIKKQQKLYAINNKEKIRHKIALRRSNKLKATPKFANLNKIKEIYKNCPKGYEVDHIIPLQGKTVCGLHVEWNLQYLPMKINRSKGNKLIDFFAVQHYMPKMAIYTNEEMEWLNV
jgi:hypothetical protein